MTDLLTAVDLVTRSIYRESTLQKAEVVGSNPTRSISYYEGTTVLN
jgi:hypothetical protein